MHGYYDVGIGETQEEVLSVIVRLLDIWPNSMALHPNLLISQRTQIPSTSIVPESLHGDGQKFHCQVKKFS